MSKKLVTRAARKRRNNKRAIFLIGFILLISIPVLYHLYYKPREVKSGIVTLHKVFTNHKHGIWSAQFSPDGTLLASGSIDSTLTIREKESGRVRLNLKHSAGITGIAFSPDGQYIIASGYDGKIKLWKTADGSLVKVFPGNGTVIWSVAYHKSGKMIAGAGEDKTIKLWDVETGGLLKTLQGHTLNVWAIKFSPDGTKLASGSFDKMVKLWDVNTGTLIRNMKGHTEAVVALDFTPDGQQVASTSDDVTIRFWNVHDGSLARTLKDGPEHVQAIAFSPDGKRMITGGRDKSTFGELLQNFLGDSKFNTGISARLWDLETGKVIQTFDKHTNDANDVAYCPDGKWIATAGWDHAVHLWKINN
ncbi:MAG TPA: WD40 repeat domain-containing protein [Chitinophagaceae bacterium]|nr:WD40 repeat domain-containing protein [Chitinophagaceae bacterium]